MLGILNLCTIQPWTILLEFDTFWLANQTRTELLFGGFLFYLYCMFVRFMLRAILVIATMCLIGEDLGWEQVW